MVTAICNYGSFEGIENFISNVGFNVFEEKITVLHKRGLLGLYVTDVTVCIIFFCNRLCIMLCIRSTLLHFVIPG